MTRRTRKHSTLTPLTRGVATLLAGVGFGVVVVALNHAESLPFRTLSLVTGGGAGWAIFGILIAAWWQRRLALSVAAAYVALTVAVTTYYVADALAAGSPVTRELHEMRRWVLAALVVAVPLGLVGWRARRDGTWLGVMALLVAPVGFAAESAIYLDGFEWLRPLERIVRVGIIAGALVVAARLVQHQLRRPALRAGSAPSVLDRDRAPDSVQRRLRG